jgi:hypothetical protein
MLGPRTQRSLISGVVAAVLVVFSLLVHSYERYYRGPDDSFFIGTSENQNLGRVRQWR